MQPNLHTVRDELLKAYPKKTARKRAEQTVINQRRGDGAVPEIKASVRTTPCAMRVAEKIFSAFLDRQDCDAPEESFELTM